MKKIFLLIALVSIGAFSQTNPSVFKNGIDTKLIALDTLTTVQRDALILKASKGYVIFNATTNTLNVHNGTSWGEVTGGGGGATNLTTTQTPTTVVINSDTGTDASIPLGNGTNAGVSVNNYSNADKALVASALQSADLPSFLEFDETDKTLWNNGKNNLSNNTSFGEYISPNLTTGTANSIFGYGALNFLTTGFSNSVFGRSALSNITTTSNNTVMGDIAGTYIADGSTVLSGLSNSTFFGARTKALNIGDVNEIVIGYDAIGNGSNTVNLGNDDIIGTYLKGDVYLKQGKKLVWDTGFGNTSTLEPANASGNVVHVLPGTSGTIALISDITSTPISDTAYGVGWNGDTTTGASKNAIYDKFESLAATIPTIPTTYAASNITVADAGSLTSQTNVEGYLAENRGLINTNTANIATHETRLDDLEAVTPVNTAFRTVTPSAGVFTEAYNEAQPNISFTITQNTAVTLTTIANGDFGIVEVINSTTTPYIVQLNGITNRTRTVTNETVSFTYTTNATGVTWYENYKTQATSGSGESTNYAAQTGTGTSVINFTDNNFVDITLTANEVATFTAPSTTTRDLTLYVRQDATGGRTFTFPTYEWGFAGGTRPTITSAPNALDIFKIDYLGGKYYVTSVMQNLVAVDTPLSYTIVARVNGGGTDIIATDAEINYEGGNSTPPIIGTNYNMSAPIGTGGVFGSAGISWIRDASIPVGLPTADYDTLYDNLRYGDNEYTFPKGNGTYKVTLYLAEDQAAQTVGGRVFDVIIEGITVETGVDIRDEYGIGARAVAKIYDNIVVTDGVLTLSTNSTANLVLKAGIQIEKQD